VEHLTGRGFGASQYDEPGGMAYDGYEEEVQYGVRQAFSLERVLIMIYTCRCR